MSAERPTLERDPDWPSTRYSPVHVHGGEWCAKCVEHGVAEEVRRHSDQGLRDALADARLTILAHYRGEGFSVRTRPSVVRRQVRDIDALLGSPPTLDDEFAPVPDQP